MKRVFSVKVGPVAFRVGSIWSAPVDALERLYAGYPKPGHILAVLIGAIAGAVHSRGFIKGQV